MSFRGTNARGRPALPSGFFLLSAGCDWTFLRPHTRLSLRFWKVGLQLRGRRVCYDRRRLRFRLRSWLLNLPSLGDDERTGFAHEGIIVHVFIAVKEG